MNVFKCPGCKKYYEEDNIDLKTMSQGYYKIDPPEDHYYCVECGTDVTTLETIDVLELINGEIK